MTNTTTKIEPGFYGTDEETYWVSPDTGRIWCIQSPDHPASRGGPRGGPRLKSWAQFEHKALPPKAEPLSQLACDDVIVPNPICDLDAQLGPLWIEQAMKVEQT